MNTNYWAIGFAILTSLTGCSTPYVATDPAHLSSAYPNAYVKPKVLAITPKSVLKEPDTGIVQASSTIKANETSDNPQTLETMTAELLAKNPRLAQLGWAVETARGRAIQAGLYPNPVVNVTGNELGDRTGPSGIWSVPYLTQEIVTAGKLGLSEAAAQKEVDQAGMLLIAERYRLLTQLRQAYYEVVSLQRRSEILSELVSLADKTVKNTEKLLEAKEVARLDLVQLEVDLERYRTDKEATDNQIPAAFRKLSAILGATDLPLRPLAGSLEEYVPDFDLEKTKNYVVEIHPDVRIAQLGVERAQVLLRRAEVDPIPNITVGTGYTRQGQNRSNDWDLGVNFTVPLWNRNQGNIYAARSQVSEATQEISRVKNDLVERLSTAFSIYASARKRADRYKGVIIPKAEESYQLSQKAFKGGQFEYLRVLQSQRAVAEAKLEYVRALSEMWVGASGIAGLMLEDTWPQKSSTAP